MPMAALPQTPRILLQRLRRAWLMHMKQKPGGIFFRPRLRSFLPRKERAEQANALLAAIVNSSFDAIVSTTLDGTVTSWNKAATRLFGYSKEKMIGLHIGRLIPPEKQEEEDFILAQIAAGQAIKHYGTIRLHKDGRPLNVSITVSPMRDAAGTIIGACKIVHGISAQKRPDECLTRAATFSETALKCLGEGLYTIDGHGLVTSMNPAAEELFGWSFAELRGKKMHDMTHHHHRDGRPFPACECAGFQVLTHGQPLKNYEDVFIRKDGTFFDVMYTIAPQRDSSGKITGLIVVFSDITGRKPAEAALKRTVEQFQTLADGIPTLCWMAEPDGHIYWYNQRWYDYTGTTPGEMQGWGWQSVHDPDILPEVLTRWRASIATGVPFEMTFPLRGADGVFRPFLTRVAPVCGPDGRVRRWLGVNTDVTEERRMRAALEESETRFRLSQEAGLVGSWDWDLVTNRVRWSDLQCRRFGVDPALGESVDFDTWRNAVHPDDLAPAEASVRKAIEQGDHFDLEYRIIRSGQVQWMNGRGCVSRNADGKPVQVIGIDIDITGRKQAEAALHESEEQLRLSNEAAGIGTITIDAEAGCASYSPELAAMLGYKGAGTARMEAVFSRIHREDIARVRARYEGALRGENDGRFKLDLRFVCPGGEVRWVTWAGRVHFRERPSGLIPFRIDGACADITERKQAEEATARLAAIVTSSSDAIIGKTLDGTVTTWNEAAERLFGYSSEEMIGQPIRRLIPPERQSEEDDILTRVGAGGILENYETVRQHKSGRLFEVSVTVSPIRDAAGKVTGASKIAHDITSRKRAQEAVCESEERFRGIFEHAGTGIAITDLQGRIQSCNPAYAAILGYAQEELRGFGFPDLVHPEDREANLIEIRRLLAQEIPSFEILNRYLAKDGNPVWVHKHVSLLRDDAGKPTHILALVTDMTERKRHEDHISLLMREVNHRSKNMLTLVQAVARQTVAANPNDFIERFGERMRALAASQDLLVKNAWKGVDLDDLVRSQLAHFADLIGGRIELRGPPLFVSASAAQTIGMALHELATNAGKYGALSNDHGGVDLAWSIERNEGGEETFILCWRERGGPPVTEPSTRGFGSTVICNIAESSLDAQVELDFPVTAGSFNARPEKLWKAATRLLSLSVRSRPAERRSQASVPVSLWWRTRPLWRSRLPKQKQNVTA